MRRVLLSALLIVVAMVGAVAQPQWTYKMPDRKNRTYRYEMVQAEGSSENDARTQAIARVFQQIGMTLGQPVNTAEINRAVQQGDNYSVYSTTFNIKFNIVDYYVERLSDGRYRYSLLCQVQENANYQPEFTKYRNPDDAIALMRSAFIPGLGQICKRGKTNRIAGTLILMGEVALVGSGTLCYLSAQNKLDIMGTEKVSYADYSKAHDDYNRLRDASFVIWGAAAGLYVFNLFSAYNSKQPKNNYSFSPVILQDENRPMAGLTMRVKF